MKGAFDHGNPITAFPPIADYAFLSDCETTALVAPNGNVEWLCLPRMDSPSVFGSVLDRDAGSFRVGPADVNVPAARRYVPGTMVLETSWETRMGWVIVRDVLVIGPWHHDTERSRTHRRSPTDHDADHVMLRLIECLEGSAEIKVECEPAFDYGGLAADWSYGGEGYNEAFARSEGMNMQLRLVSDLRLGFEGPRARARTMMHEGERAFVALGWSEHGLPQSYEEAERRLSRTARFWQEWLKHGSFPDHPWRAHLQRSALTLKGLSYAPSGALIAAATTSLPETPGGDRNWDYRYSWIRDSTFMLWALYSLGFDEEANDFFYFVADVVEAEEGELQIMYGVGGESKLQEQELNHLSGYDQARPVRIGNGAYNQRQHDVWGAVLDSIYLHTRSRDQLPDRLWPIIKRQVEAALAHWREPDRGIWEVRGEPKHFTSSKVMCWVAADRGARLARIRADEATAARWETAAAEIHADICEHGVDGRGVFVQHYETTALDASVLLMPLVRFLPADDKRIRDTVLAVADELAEEGLVLRYRVEETDDGFSGEEGTFTICSFWLVSALVEIGELGRARGLCEKLLSYASPLGLYAEEIDSITGRHLGNFPQAFTHLALINAVVHIIMAERRLELRALAREPELDLPGAAREHAHVLGPCGARSVRVAPPLARVDGEHAVVSVKPLERKTPGTLLQRLRGAHEAELFGPRGRLPRRGEPDTSHRNAVLILGGLIIIGLILRLAVPRGIWLDEAISIHQARLSLHDLLQNLYIGDRQPPLYHLVLWGTIRAFGHSEFAVRLPSLIAGTLTIPVLYELGRELYDRRTGLLAAGFAAISPMLIWYSQEVRMYEFASLFGLLALLMQLRAIRDPRSMLNWAGYILASAALLWSHYFGLALVVVQLLVFVGALIYRRRAGEPSRALGLGFAYSLAVLVMVAIPLLVFAHHQYQVTGSAAGSPSGTYDYLSFYSVLSNMAWSLWGYQPDAVTVLLSALWPLFLLLSLVLLGRGGSRQTTALAAAAIALVALLIIASVFDHSLFEVRNFLILVPLVLLLIARLVTGWIRQPRVRALVVAGIAATMLLGLADEQLNDSNPRLFDFKTAIQDIQADAGPNALVLYEPRDMRYVLEYYAPNLRRQGLVKPISAATEGSPLFVLASFQDNPAFFNETNKVVGQLTFFRRLVARFKTPQTIVWEFQ